MNDSQIRRALDDITGKLSMADLVAMQGALGQLPRNDIACTYVIQGFDGSPYITRTLMPRIAGWRPLIHSIHRSDHDVWPHNHPWREAHFRVVRGGYVDERWELRGAGAVEIRCRTMRPGDTNVIRADDFHRATEVLPDTLTVGLVADRVQDWGFLVDRVVVPHERYFAMHNYADSGVES